MYSLKESLESWDSVISDKLIYVAQPIPIDGEIGNSISRVNWISKFDSGTFNIELNFVLLGERYSYFRCVIDFVIPSPMGHADLVYAKGEVDGTDWNDLMFVKICEFVDSPKRMKFERRLARVRLKRFDDLESFSGNVSNLFLKSLIAGQRANGFNGECRQSTGLVCGQEGELPREIVESRANCICELSNENGNGVRSNVLFNAKDVPTLGKIVISRDGIGLALDETINFNLQVIEVFIRSAKFHLCINQPYSQRHRNPLKEFAFTS